MRPIIAMLSDFGTRDHYAGVMKGVMLGICPDIALVDVSHDLPAHDVPAAARELTERRYARPTVSRTFERRDRFAPAAAWLARGVQLTAFGRAITDYQMLDLARPEFNGTALRGRVVRVDRFGNIVTNLDRRSCEKLTEGGGAVQLTVGE